MPGYETRIIDVDVGGHRYRLRVLSDNQQFSDPDGHGDRLGISSAQWSLFGQVWPVGILLAEVMDTAEMTGKRILELGCGIGLPSLVLQRRGADVVASDIHPLAEPFLAYNSALNGLPSVHFRQLDWEEPLPSLGAFDKIIGSDLLYERDHPEALAAVIERHARPQAEVVLTDAGRGHTSAFSREMEALGFDVEESHHPLENADGTTIRARLLRYRRGLPPRAG
ncbi:MAG: methyltransferase domain-containing protein [Gammaproteobacteria bacterium]|nr:methyltransferase domain-containing protein [Gammaproteobacteria bacterium]